MCENRDPAKFTIYVVAQTKGIWHFSASKFKGMPYLFCSVCGGLFKITPTRYDGFLLEPVNIGVEHFQSALVSEIYKEG